MKIKKEYLKVHLLLFIALLGPIASCEDYLEENPSSQFTSDFVYNTADGLEAGVVGLYDLQRAFWEKTRTNNGSNPIVLDARDDLTIPRGGEISRYGRMRNGTTPENSGVFGDYWRTYYQIVDRANSLIAAAENIEDFDEDRKAQALAEARFFRANSVFILYKLFKNIHVTTEPTKPENALDIILTNTPRAEIFELIENDLDFSIANLEYTTDQFGRITQGVARHVKAEVALWQEDWAEAKAQSEAVINSGTHALVSETGEVFSGTLNHQETLWALQFKNQVNGTANRINFNLMPNYAERIPGSKYTIEQGGRGFGWLTLNNYLRDLLNEDPNDSRIKGSYYVQDYVYNDAATLPEGETLGTKIIHPKWQEFAEKASDRNFWFIRLNAGCKKYFPDDGIPTISNQVKNIMLYRLAETYLFAAEANMRLGNTGDAIAQLNAVRTRANTAPVDAIDLDAILDEQARELAFEGRRMYMLKRTGRLYNYIVDHAGYGMAGDSSEENSTDGGAENTPEKPLPYRNDARSVMMPHMVNWPIPLAEIDLLGPDYPQNDGY